MNRCALVKRLCDCFSELQQCDWEELLRGLDLKALDDRFRVLTQAEELKIFCVEEILETYRGETVVFAPWCSIAFLGDRFCCSLCGRPEVRHGDAETVMKVVSGWMREYLEAAA